MLISPYSQRVVLRPVTLASQCILATAILLGSTAPLEILLEISPHQAGLGTFAWLLTYLCALGGLLFSQGVNWITWVIRYRILLVLLLFGAMLTVPWSVDPGLSFNRLIHLIGTSIVGIYLGFALPAAKIMQIFGILLAGLMASSILAVQFFPDFALEFHEGSLVWKGILDNKNTLGFWAATGIMLYPWFIVKAQLRVHRILALVTLIICVFVLYQSQSAGSIIALTTAFSVMAYLLMSQKLQLGATAMIILGVLMTILVSLTINNIDIAAAAGRSTDLTGRLEIWKQTWKLIEHRPLTGYGYGTLWSPTDETVWIQERYTDFTWVVYHAHNGLLQIASEIGLPLTAIALLFTVQQLVEIIHCQYREHQSGAIFTVGFVIAYLVSNYTEARFMQSRELFWLFFIALPVSLIRQVRIEQPSTQQVPSPVDDLDDRRVRYPDEIIPAPQSKLRALRDAKKVRRLRRDSLRISHSKRND